MMALTKQDIINEYNSIRQKQGKNYEAARQEYRTLRGEEPPSSQALTVYGYLDTYWKSQYNALKKKANKNNFVLGDDGSVRDKPIPPPEAPQKTREQKEAERKQAEAEKEAERKDKAKWEKQVKDMDEAEKARRARQKKQKEEDDRKRREEERKRREEESRLAKAEREKRKKAFDDDLKQRAQEYAAQRSNAYSQRKKNEAKEAEDRKNKFQEDQKNRIKQAEQDAIDARRKIAEMAQKELDDAAARKEKGEMYSGSSSQALQEGKDALKDLWESMSIEAQVRATREALDGARNNISSAAEDVTGIVSNGLKTYVQNTANGIAEAALASAQNKHLLDLEMQLASQQLASKIVMDQISDQVYEKVHGMQNTIKDARDMLLWQKAYAAAYIKNTFGNPAFMANVATIAYSKINNYIEAITVEQVNSANDKIESVYQSIDKKIEQTSTNVVNKLDDLSKIDIVKNLNDKLTNIVSFKGLEAKLNKSPLGQLIAPAVGVIGQACNLVVVSYVQSSSIGKAINTVTQKVIVLQQGLKQAKDFIQSRAKMAREYLENLKNKAKEAVKQFAQKIVSDITSKISVAVGGAVGQAVGGGF